MGATNHGNQDITYNYFEEATAENFNKRHVDIRPQGIYKGGYLKKVTDSEILLTPFTVEIGDDNTQICSKSTSNATLNSGTLDSGSISSATSYIVLRWSFSEQVDNFVEVHAISSAENAQSNDIIIGKCVFSEATLTGFDYSERTFLNVQDLFLKVEATEVEELYVRVRAGRIQTSSTTIVIPEQKVGPFEVPSSPNSRIDLVYVTSTGTVSIQKGSAAPSPAAPDYAGKLVIAEVRVVNGDTNITADRITDTRAFITIRGYLGGDYTKVSDQVTSGSGPQANESNKWTTRRLTTINNDDGGHCTLNNNQITLDAGTYRCHISCPVYYQARDHKARLRNVTDGVTVLVGTSEYLHDDYGRNTSRSFIVGQFTITSSKTFEIQHYKKGGYWGNPASVGEVEIYTVGEFWKVA